MNNLNGILLVIASMAAFTLEDMFIKRLSGEIPVGQILIMLGIGSGSVFACMALIKGENLFPRQAWRGVVLLRSGAEAFGAMAFATALSLVDISTVAAVFQALPLVITMGAALFLGEQVGWRRWSAIAVGFAGVMLIVRPGGAEFDPNVFWALLAVVALGGRDLAVRQVPRSVPHILLAVYGFTAVVPVGLVQLSITGGAIWPDTYLWTLIGGAVAVGVTAYYLLVSATRIGDVAVITPFRYSRLVFALCVGILVFGERPDLATYAGAALIIGSGIYTFVRERRLARRMDAVDPTLV